MTAKRQNNLRLLLRRKIWRAVLEFEEETGVWVTEITLKRSLETAARMEEMKVELK